MGSGSHFLRLKSLATTKFFGLGHAGARRATNFFLKKIRCFSLCPRQLPKSPHACMGGGAAPPGRYFPDGTWSCIPEHAVRSVNFIAEQQYSAPFPTHRMLLVAEFKFAHSFAFVQVAYQHFNFLNNSSCPRLHAAYRIRRTGRARAAGGRAGLSALVPLPVFLSLLV